MLELCLWLKSEFEAIGLSGQCSFLVSKVQKWLGVFPLPPGRDDSPLKGYPAALNLQYTLFYTLGGERQSTLPKNNFITKQPQLEFKHGLLQPESVY